MTAHHRTADWQAARRAARPKIEALLPQPCIECGRPIHRGDRWQVGHRTPVAVAKRMGWTTSQINALRNLGPVHTKAPGQRACNQVEGGKLGARIANEARRSVERMPNW